MQRKIRQMSSPLLALIWKWYKPTIYNIAYLAVYMSGSKASFHEKPVQFVFTLSCFFFYEIFSSYQPSPYHKLPEVFIASTGEFDHHIKSRSLICSHNSQVLVLDSVWFWVSYFFTVDLHFFSCKIEKGSEGSSGTLLGLTVHGRLCTYQEHFKRSRNARPKTSSSLIMEFQILCCPLGKWKDLKLWVLGLSDPNQQNRHLKRV